MYSGGKLLNATGWKVGWAIAPEKILRLGCIINNTTTYITNNPAQIAMSKVLQLASEPGSSGNSSLSFLENTRKQFTEVRDFLSKEVSEMDLPWKPLPCHSGYFLMADVSECRNLIPSRYFDSHDYDEANEEGYKHACNHLYMPGEQRIPLDLAFARWMGRENGVTMMPNSFFYHPKSHLISENYVRLAICKDLESVRKVCQRLRAIKI